MFSPACYQLFFLFSVLAMFSSVPIETQPRKIPHCPAGSRVMYRPDGEPRKCLPHQSNLCLSALDDRTDASTVCCWHNHVDYFCCVDVPGEQCPEYSNVTVVIHNNFPHSAFPVKTFHFRRGIENEVDFINRN